MLSPTSVGSTLSSPLFTLVSNTGVRFNTEQLHPHTLSFDKQGYLRVDDCRIYILNTGRVVHESFFLTREVIQVNNHGTTITFSIDSGFIQGEFIDMDESTLPDGLAMTDSQSSDADAYVEEKAREDAQPLYFLLEEI